MNSPNLLFLIPIAALSAACGSIENERIAAVTINGNCGMCQKTIEKAALVPGVAEAEWDRKTRKATIRYDSTRTSAGAVLQRIANAGYDNERFVAPDAAYAALPECCQYDRAGTNIPSPDANAVEHGH